MIRLSFTVPGYWELHIKPEMMLVSNDCRLDGIMHYVFGGV
jgi:hypothetical protein